MAENTEWKITPSGEKQLTVVLPDNASIAEGKAEVLPETLARAILQSLEIERMSRLCVDYQKTSTGEHCGIQL